MSVFEELAQGAKLIDVRSKAEYDDAHVEQSQLIPLGDLAEADLGDKDQAIFIHCAAGGRAEQAKQILEAKGYQKITNLGGLDDLEALGFDII